MAQGDGNLRIRRMLLRPGSDRSLHARLELIARTLLPGALARRQATLVATATLTVPRLRVRLAPGLAQADDEAIAEAWAAQLMAALAAELSTPRQQEATGRTRAAADGLQPTSPLQADAPGLRQPLATARSSTHSHGPTQAFAADGSAAEDQPAPRATLRADTLGRALLDQAKPTVSGSNAQIQAHQHPDHEHPPGAARSRSGDRIAPQPGAAEIAVLGALGEQQKMAPFPAPAPLPPLAASHPHVERHAGGGAQRSALGDDQQRRNHARTGAALATELATDGHDPQRRDARPNDSGWLTDQADVIARGWPTPTEIMACLHLVCFRQGRRPSANEAAAPIAAGDRQRLERLRQWHEAGRVPWSQVFDFEALWQRLGEADAEAPAMSESMFARDSRIDSEGDAGRLASADADLTRARAPSLPADGSPGRAVSSTAAPYRSVTPPAPKLDAHRVGISSATAQDREGSPAGRYDLPTPENSNTAARQPGPPSGSGSARGLAARAVERTQPAGYPAPRPSPAETLTWLHLPAFRQRRPLTAGDLTQAPTPDDRRRLQRLAGLVADGAIRLTEVADLERLWAALAEPHDRVAPKGEADRPSEPDAQAPPVASWQEQTAAASAEHALIRSDPLWHCALTTDSPVSARAAICALLATANSDETAQLLRLWQERNPAQRAALLLFLAGAWPAQVRASARSLAAVARLAQRLGSDTTIPPPALSSAELSHARTTLVALGWSPGRSGQPAFASLIKTASETRVSSEVASLIPLIARVFAQESAVVSSTRLATSQPQPQPSAAAVDHHLFSFASEASPPAPAESGEAAGQTAALSTSPQHTPAVEITSFDHGSWRTEMAPTTAQAATHESHSETALAPLETGEVTAFARRTQRATISPEPSATGSTHRAASILAAQAASSGAHADATGYAVERATVSSTHAVEQTYESAPSANRDRLAINPEVGKQSGFAAPASRAGGRISDAAQTGAVDGSTPEMSIAATVATSAEAHADATENAVERAIVSSTHAVEQTYETAPSANRDRLAINQEVGKQSGFAAATSRAGGRISDAAQTGAVDGSTPEMSIAATVATSALPAQDRAPGTKAGDHRAGIVRDGGTGSAPDTTPLPSPHRLTSRFSQEPSRPAENSEKTPHSRRDGADASPERATRDAISPAGFTSGDTAQPLNASHDDQLTTGLDPSDADRPLATTASAEAGIAAGSRQRSATAPEHELLAHTEPGQELDSEASERDAGTDIGVGPAGETAQDPDHDFFVVLDAGESVSAADSVLDGPVAVRESPETAPRPAHAASASQRTPGTGGESGPRDQLQEHAVENAGASPGRDTEPDNTIPPGDGGVDANLREHSSAQVWQILRATADAIAASPPGSADADSPADDPQRELHPLTASTTRLTDEGAFCEPTALSPALPESAPPAATGIHATSTPVPAASPTKPAAEHLYVLSQRTSEPDPAHADAPPLDEPRPARAPMNPLRFAVGSPDEQEPQSSSAARALLPATTQFEAQAVTTMPGDPPSRSTALAAQPAAASAALASWRNGLSGWREFCLSAGQAGLPMASIAHELLRERVRLHAEIARQAAPPDELTALALVATGRLQPSSLERPAVIAEGLRWLHSAAAARAGVRPPWRGATPTLDEVLALLAQAATRNPVPSTTARSSRPPAPAPATAATEQLMSDMAGLALLHPWLVPAMREVVTILAATSAEAVLRARGELLLQAVPPDLAADGWNDPVLRLLIGLDPTGHECPPPVHAPLVLAERLTAPTHRLLRSFAQAVPGLRAHGDQLLRDHFMRRRARLRVRGASWDIALGRNQLDVLLAASPIPLGMVKLPWTPLMELHFADDGAGPVLACPPR